MKGTWRRRVRFDPPPRSVAGPPDGGYPLTSARHLTYPFRMRTQRSIPRDLVCIAAVLLLLAGTATARTIRVPRDHATIQAAVDQAVYGDVILVSKATYEEDVRITTSGLRLIGAGRPVLDGRSVPLVIESCSSVVIEGFRIQGSRADGVLIRQCSSVTILKCAIRETTRCGIRVEGSAHVVIRGGSFADIGDAGVALVTDGFGIKTRDCVIIRNDFRSADDDAIVVQGDRNAIQKNTIGEVRGIGIHLFGGEDNLVEKNVLKGVGDIGILVRAVRTTIFKNKVSRSGSDGIQVDTSGNVLTKNTANRSGDDGFEMNAGGNEVIRNKARRNGGYDLEVSLTDDTNVYEKNKFKKTSE